MTHDPASTALYPAWVVGGVVLIVLNCIFADLLNSQPYRTELTFQPVTPSPGEQARRSFASVVQHAPWASLWYALLGLCAFCHRGVFRLRLGRHHRVRTVLLLARGRARKPLRPVGNARAGAGDRVFRPKA